MEAGVGSELRADARRNRERIIAAARDLFGDAADVPMYEVARHAGVGQATLYRHFPDRTALVNAIAEVEFADIVALAQERGAEPDGLQVLLEAMALKLARIPGLVAVIRADRSGLSREHRRDESAQLFAGPLAAARAAGSVRADLEMDDLQSILMMLEAAISDVSSEAAREAGARRALALILDGIRGDDAGPEPAAGR